MSAPKEQSSLIGEAMRRRSATARRDGSVTRV